MSEEKSKEQLKEELKQTLQDLRDERLQEPRRGGLIPDPARQLAKKVAELEERIERLENKIDGMKSVTDMFTPLA